MITAVQNPRLSALARYWEDRRGHSVMPSPARIDPIDIPHLLPIVALIDFPSRLIRLLGSEATDAIGREMRGHPISAVDFGSFTPSWIDAFELVIESRRPATAKGFFGAGTKRHAIEVVLAPLSYGGESVDRILGGLHIHKCPLEYEQLCETAAYVVPLTVPTLERFALLSARRG